MPWNPPNRASKPYYFSFSPPRQRENCSHYRASDLGAAFRPGPSARLWFRCETFSLATPKGRLRRMLGRAILELHSVLRNSPNCASKPYYFSFSPPRQRENCSQYRAGDLGAAFRPGHSARLWFRFETFSFATPKGRLRPILGKAT